MDDRRVLNGIFWVLRSGAPWRDLPRSLGPYTTSYNRPCILALLLLLRLFQRLTQPDVPVVGVGK